MRLISGDLKEEVRGNVAPRLLLTFLSVLMRSVIGGERDVVLMRCRVRVIIYFQRYRILASCYIRLTLKVCSFVRQLFTSVCAVLICPVYLWLCAKQ
jgi:hypothetical protein